MKRKIHSLIVTVRITSIFLKFKFYIDTSTYNSYVEDAMVKKALSKCLELISRY